MVWDFAMKHAFAGAVLMIGLFAAATPAAAHTRPRRSSTRPHAQDAPPAQNAPAENATTVRSRATITTRRRSSAPPVTWINRA